jgi:hypothetical protein
MRIWHQSFTDLDTVSRYHRTSSNMPLRVAEPGVGITVHGFETGTCGRHFVPRRRWRSAPLRREGGRGDAATFSC